MKQKRRYTWILAPVTMVLLILDTKTAIFAASDGISMCLHAIVPSLFPFIVISSFVVQELMGQDIPFLQPIGKLCRIPKGAESLLLIGLLGGYPVGAHCVYDSYQKGFITRADAERMVCICNNAGPAFILGIVGQIFSNSKAVWVLWGIHIVVTMFVGAILPGLSSSDCTFSNVQKISFVHIVQRSVKTMATICAWVLMFRILIAYLDKYILHILPQKDGVLFAGLIELANGCLLLKNIAEESTRFVICSVILGFGGFSVAMQTASVTEKIGAKIYFPGKVIHGSISGILAVLFVPFVFHGTKIYVKALIIFGIILLITACQALKPAFKKGIAFSRKMVYNKKKSYI